MTWGVMRLSPIAMLVLSVSCSVRPNEIAGRACDELHACLEGRRCVDGVCVDPVGAPINSPFVDSGEPLPVVTDCGADAGPCSAGVGSCQRSGVWTCFDGGIVCNMPPGVPNDEVCGDSQDNDCDGRPDVTREVSLSNAAGAYEHFSWVASGDGGYVGLYESTRNNQRRVYFRRFDAKLAPQGEELAIGPAQAATLPMHPSFVVANNEAYVAWVNDNNGSARVQLSTFDLANPAGTFQVRRSFPNEPITNVHPRISTSGSGAQQFVFVLWARGANGQLMGGVYQPDGDEVAGTALQALGFAANQKVLDVSITNAGNNDYQVGWLTEDVGGGFTVRSQRIQETLNAMGVANITSLNRPSSPRVLRNFDGVSMEDNETGMVWAEQVALADWSVRGAYAPLVSAVGVTTASAVGGQVCLDAVATPKGTVVVWSESQTGTMQARTLDGGLPIDLTPVNAKPVGVAQPPTVARAAPYLAVGYATDGGIYGQLACER
ncbi:MAG: hypothetical protein ACT4TC_06755 [Myxococcaceae bacterium]